jgi:iron complex transport system substrate-binding protein
MRLLDRLRFLPPSRLAPAILLALSCGVEVASASPTRVVSINVCTDQMAMMVAAEGQLYSVTHLATDPHTSAMVDKAKGYVVNHGLAEEIFLMKPDLVLAGTYTSRAAVELLRGLGIRVELFDPVNTFDDVREQFLRIGQMMDRETQAQAVVAELDAGLADLAANAKNVTALGWSSNSYATGGGTFTDEVMTKAGLTNIATREGIQGGARVPLEMLLAEGPDLVVTGSTSYERPAMAQDNFSHPAYRAYVEDGKQVSVPDKFWVCGAPFTLEAVRILRDAAKAVQ